MIDWHLEYHLAWKSQHPLQAAQRLLVVVIVSGNRRRPLVLPFFSLTLTSESGYGHISIHCPFPLRLIFCTPPVETPEGRSRCRVSVTSTSVNQPSSDFRSNLSGLFFLLDPLSAVGLLIAQVVGQIPYLVLGRTWGLNKKHEGTDA
jgi:hypothetical protein